MVKIKNLISNFDMWLDDVGSRLEKKRFSFNPNIWGSILFLIAASIFLFIMPSQIHVVGNDSINAQTFPKIVLLTILFLSFINLVKEIVKICLKKPCYKMEINLLHEVRALIIFALILAYYFLLDLIGFYASSVLFGLGMTAYFRVKKWSYYAIVVIAAVIIAVVFKNVLNVRLP